jgi:putative peptidoglycan lipid II flippase
MVINVVLDLVLVRWFGYLGLALGTAIAALSNAAALLYALRRRLNGLEGGRLLGSLARIAAASALMGVAAIAMDRLLDGVLPGSHVLTQAVRLGVTIGVALGVLAAAAAALRIREFHESVALVMRRFQQS